MPRVAMIGTAALLAVAALARAEDEATQVRVRVATFRGEPVAGARLEVRRWVHDAFDPMWPGAGAPTIDAWWQVTRAGADDSPVATAKTDADGWARLDRLPDGVFDVTAHVAGRAVRGAQVISPPVRGAPPRTIHLDAGHTVTGRVLGEDGSAVAGALVVASFPPAGTARWASRERPLVARADGRGAFRIEGVPAGTVDLQACPPQTWFDRSHLVRVPQEEPARIVLPLYLLDAVVNDAKTGAPLAGARILFSTSGFHMSNTLVRVTTDAQGRLRLRVPNRWLGRGEVHARGYLRGLRVGDPKINPPNLERLAGRRVEFRAVPAAPVRGVVRDAAGPVAGALVRATWLAGLELASVTATSRADGTFELWVPARLVHLAARRPGVREEDSEIDVLLATGKQGEAGLVRVPATGHDSLRLRLPPRDRVGQIAGRVVSATGVPLTAWLKLVGAGGRRAAATAADGSFLIRNVPAGEARLSVRTVRGAQVTGGPYRVEAAKTTSGVEIVLPAQPQARVEGRVAGPAGRLGSDAYVADLWDGGRRHPVARDGSFAFVAHALNGEVTVEAIGKGIWGALAEAACPKGGTARLGDLVLSELLVASIGVVEAPAGAPILRATATLYDPPDAIACGAFERPSDLRIWRADKTGRIRIPMPRAGAWEIHVRAPGFAGRDLPVGWAGDVVPLGRPAAIAGRVRFADGRPAAGVRVEATPEDWDCDVAYSEHVALTDAGGRFRFEGVAPVATHIHVESAGGGPSIAELRVRKVAAPNEALDLVVVPALTIEGRVLDVRGRPVAHAEVQAERRGDQEAPTLEAKADERGVFRIAGALAGKYDLLAGRDIGWPDARVEGVAAGTRGLIVRADLGYRIAGRVVDGAGRPRAGWIVFATTPKGGIDPRRVRTGADGRFSLEELTGGAWTLRLGCWGHKEPDSGGVAVPAGTTDVLLVLK